MRRPHRGPQRRPRNHRARSRPVDRGGFVADAWWCRALVAAAGRTAAADRLVRLNVSAEQLSRAAPRAALLDAADLVTGEYGARVARDEWSPTALVGAA